MSETTLLAESQRDATNSLFSSAEAAVTFALSVRSRSMTKDTLGALRGVGGAGKMAREEIPGQAGMILRALQPMTESAFAILVAKLATRQFPCNCGRACCSGWRVNLAWAEARSTVAMESVEAFSGMLTHYRLRDGLVRRWAGERVDIGKLADACGVNRNTVGTHNKVARDWLQRRFVQAVAQADSLLRADGIDPEGVNA